METIYRLILQGKTYCGIASICYHKCRGVIFVPSTNSKIGDQWYESALKFTTLNEDEVLLVRGSDMCKAIIKGEHSNVKIFIIPRRTILAFVKKYNNNWDMVERLIQSMNVGIKIIDEAHMDFNTIVNIDCHANTKLTYYMTSSPSRSDKYEKKVYSKLFGTIPKHGKSLKTKEQNHIIPLIMMFNSKPTNKQVSEIKTMHGPSTAKYGDYLLNKNGAKEEFIDAYTFAIYWLMRFRRNGGKMLVLCPTKKFAIELAELTNKIFTHYSTGLYIGSGKDKPKQLENDIIFSTIKSMGVGSEVSGLQFTINTLTYASDVLVDQLSGRLRKIDGSKSIYCELVNIEHPVASRHYKEREKFIKRKAKDGKLLIHSINYDNIEEMIEFFNKRRWYDEDGKLRDSKGYYIIGKR